MEARGGLRSRDSGEVLGSQDFWGDPAAGLRRKHLGARVQSAGITLQAARQAREAGVRSGQVVSSKEASSVQDQWRRQGLGPRGLSALSRFQVSSV